LFWADGGPTLSDDLEFIDFQRNATMNCAKKIVDIIVSSA